MEVTEHTPEEGMLQPRSRILCALLATVCPLLAQVYPGGGYVITLKPDPPLANAVAGTAYNLIFTATGGVAPYTWSVAAGALPPGLKLNPSTGTVDGTPTSDGVFPFTLQVSDLGKVTATRSYTIAVKAALTITTSSPLANGTARASYSATFSVTGGWPPYTWSALSALPAGLTLNPTSGALSGTPTSAGSFTFTVKATDSYQFSASKSFSLTVQSAAQLQTSVGSLAFSAGVGGDSPVSQSFLVTTPDQSAARFSVQVNGGSPNTAPPAWISVQPRAGVTPARVSVSADPSSLRATAYSARVLIISADGTQTITLPVTFTVDTRPPALEVIPDYLRLTAPGQPTAATQATLLIHNAGGDGPINFQASVPDYPWLTVEPASGTTSPDSYTLLRVIANPLGLQRDAYRGVVRITSSAGKVEVPVAFVLPDAGPALALSSNGIRFDARQSQGAGNTQTVNILNIGDSTAHWTADLLAGQEWLSLGTPSGEVTPAASGSLSITANPGALTGGAYYAMIRISDPDALNSPQYLTAVLNLASSSSAPAPEVSPSGLVFTSDAGASTPLRQTLRVYASSAAPVGFKASPVTADGAGWLTADPASGEVSSRASAQLTITANPTNLKPGIYSGEVNVSLAGDGVREASVTLIVSAAGAAASKSTRSAAGCAPTRLALTYTSLPGAFSAPASWPQPLSVRVADDCGSPVLNAQVVASFSNGDPPLSLNLSDAQNGIYSGAWIPAAAASPASIVARSAAPGFAIASAQLDGSVSANRAPVQKINGVVHTFNPVTAAPLAPGTIVKILGSELASISSEAGVLPLPITLSSVTVLIGGFRAALFSVASDRLEAQLPVELTPGRQYQLVVNTGDAFTVADTIAITAVQPGVSASSGGQAVAQHADSTPVTDAAPAAPAELVTVFLAGMGATDTPVRTGQPAPNDPAALALAQPLITLNGKQADVLFAGLSPGFVGLYSVTLRVPADADTGNLTLVVAQNGVTANAVTVPVAR